METPFLESLFRLQVQRTIIPDKYYIKVKTQHDAVQLFYGAARACLMKRLVVIDVSVAHHTHSSLTPHPCCHSSPFRPSASQPGNLTKSTGSYSVWADETPLTALLKGTWATWHLTGAIKTDQAHPTQDKLWWKLTTASPRKLALSSHNTEKTIMTSTLYAQIKKVQIWTSVLTINWQQGVFFFV